MRKPRRPADAPALDQNSHRAELAFILNEARGVLALAHAIDATVGPLAWSYSAERLGAARATVRQAAPKLVERLLELSARLERLLVLAEQQSRLPTESSRPG